jgi:hypothetical protein
MAAGLGFKDFQTGEVLTAADVDGYLMQGVWVFASATARDAAVTSPQEGNFAYLKDTNVTTYYTGSAWANLDTTGMTNPMTTTGDTIYSSSGSTPARLGIGTTGQVLTVAGGVPSWATPAGGGGKVLQVVQATYATATTIASTSFTDTGLSGSITPSSASSKILIMFNQSSAYNRNLNQQGLSIKLLRDSTTVYSQDGSVSGGYNTDYLEIETVSSPKNISRYFYANGIYLDSPATTSALTYKTQARCFDTADSGQARFQVNSATSTITLMEIGA